MFKKFTILAFGLIFCNLCCAGFEDFDYQDIPSQQVTHAGALLIKKYPENHPDGHGEQLCVLLGHDRNFDTYAPPAGSVEKNIDYVLINDKKYYSSYKTLQREVLEETGGLVCLSDDVIENSPMIYSPNFQDLLAIVRDDTLSCAKLCQSVQQSIADNSKDAGWKEMDRYCTFPVNAIIATAQIMKTHFDQGGTINNLPSSILSNRKANLSNTPLVLVNCRGSGKLEVDAYYMAAIADTLPQFQEIIQKWD